MTAQEKKVYYNRVRRTCKLHEIEIVYDGVPKMYCAVELVKDGSVMFADRALAASRSTLIGSGCTKR
jgi:hypothetical protein